jgi:hypothetical protein
MLPLLFKQLSHLHKRPVKLGKGKNKATRTQSPHSKDLNLSKKKFCFLGADCLPEPQERCQKGFLFFKEKHGLMLLVKKNPQKTARDLN